MVPPEKPSNHSVRLSPDPSLQNNGKDHLCSPDSLNDSPGHKTPQHTLKRPTLSNSSPILLPKGTQKKPTCSVKSLCMTLIKPLIGLRTAWDKNSASFIQWRFSLAFLPEVCFLNNNIKNQVSEKFFPFQNTTTFSKNGSIGKTFFTLPF